MDRKRKALFPQIEIMVDDGPPAVWIRIQHFGGGISAQAGNWIYEEWHPIGNAKHYLIKQYPILTNIYDWNSDKWNEYMLRRALL